MQAIDEQLEKNDTVGLSAEEHRRLRVQQRKAAFEKLRKALEVFEAAVATGTVVPTMTKDGVRYRQWDHVYHSYLALRRLYVTPRAKSGWVRNPDGPGAVPDPTSFTAWLLQRAKFQDAFYGRPRADGKRYFDGVPPQVADVIRGYRTAWSRWHKKSDAYKAKHRAYMREYMRARRARAKQAAAS